MASESGGPLRPAARPSCSEPPAPSQKLHFPPEPRVPRTKFQGPPGSKRPQGVFLHSLGPAGLREEVMGAAPRGSHP